ncbi:MAG: AraC family transcriptional regulator [Desulfobacter sp.]|nr:MAG: AraC family transcriptional regulator [Desulfobacter sp.]
METYLSTMDRQRPIFASPNHFGTKSNSFEKLIESEFTLTQFPAYTLVLEKDHRISQVGYICKGSLNLLGTSLKGEAYRKGLMGKGDFFGLELFFDNGLALCDALSLETLDCYVIDSHRLIELVTKIPEFKTYLEGILFETMKRFFHLPAMPADTGTIVPPTAKTSRFDKAVAFIDTHYMNPLTLDDVARKAGLSRFYFSRMFKKETGHSFKDYLNINRMEAAKKLLGLQDMNISQTCYSVGFNDVSYFARIFKRYQGESPSSFRKKTMEG